MSHIKVKITQIIIYRYILRPSRTMLKMVCCVWRLFFYLRFFFAPAGSILAVVKFTQGIFLFLLVSRQKSGRRDQVSMNHADTQGDPAG